MSAISEVNNFLSRKAWIPTNRIFLKEKLETQYLLSAYVRVRKSQTD